MNIGFRGNRGQNKAIRCVAARKVKKQSERWIASYFHLRLLPRRHRSTFWEYARDVGRCSRALGVIQMLFLDVIPATPGEQGGGKVRRKAPLKLWARGDWPG